ncbi:MipA/OmpV family protein [Shewanella sp. 3B26]|jgi:outer membrane protein|uniref:MipA/OmpV family protein n=1 Tax=Shewanella zhuhaiensis TaxID=2919576 RepID=A0AAJ1FB74_9GAMM|nr:MipA/OmpV family protein [Shewanella zhuhaiensis]MCH4294815.1 MipA/OmpV family protein [Shewanella zhuhaiensis]
MKSLFCGLILSAISLSPLAARAELVCDDTTDCITKGSWDLGIAFGYGQKTNPLKDFKDIPIYVLPTIAYYGDNWFFDNGAVGYTLTEQERFTVNLVTGFSSDRAFFYRWDPSNIFLAGSSRSFEQSPFRSLPIQMTAESQQIGELESRHFTYLGGVEAYVYNRFGTWRLALLHDLFDVHDGMEGQVKWNYHLAHKNLSLDFAVFFDWKSQEVVNYYYGVRPSESAYWSDKYRAEDGWNRGAELTARYHLTPEWELLMTARYTQFADTIAASPLLDEDDSYAYLIGAAYRF